MPLLRQLLSRFLRLAKVDACNHEPKDWSDGSEAAAEEPADAVHHPAILGALLVWSYILGGAVRRCAAIRCSGGHRLPNHMCLHHLRVARLSHGADRRAAFKGVLGLVTSAIAIEHCGTRIRFRKRATASIRSPTLFACSARRTSLQSVKYQRLMKR